MIKLLVKKRHLLSLQEIKKKDIGHAAFGNLQA